MHKVATLILVVVLAAGGYFIGGIVNALTEGESVGRMFGGGVVEQAVQILLAIAAILLGMEYFVPVVPFF